MRSNPPKAGWYADVQIPGGERYWDGTQWTDQRRDGEGRVPVRMGAEQRSRTQMGSGMYAIIGLIGYVVAGALYGGGYGALAAVIGAFALGFSLVAIIATGVRIGQREHAEETQSRG